MPGEILDGGREPFRIKVGARSIHCPCNASDLASPEIAFFWTLRAQRDISLAPRKIEYTVVHRKLDNDAGVTLAECDKVGSEQAVGEGFCGGEAKAAGELVVVTGDAPSNRKGIVLHAC